VPRAERREFFGEEASRIEFETGIERLIAMGGAPVAIDYAPFLATARLLYEGPWVAERYLVVRALHAKQPQAFHPVTRQIIETGMHYSAADTFEAFYKLEGLRAQTRPVWDKADILFLPTTPTIYTLAEVESDPIRLNSNLGIYTNFVNFLDLSAIAVPSGLRANGTPVGATSIARGLSEGMLSGLAAEFHARGQLPMGATGVNLPLS
jgi:allophanate hydrolase